MTNLLILSIILLFAVWNGLVIRWKLTGNGSDLWHAVGFVIRIMPVFLIWDNYTVFLLYFNFAWTVYDMIINLINGWNLFYIGKTSTTEKLFGKLTLIGKAILLILTLIYILI